MTDDLELVRRLGGLLAPDAHPGARERVRARLATPPVRRRPVWRRPLTVAGPVLAAAAVVALVLVGRAGDPGHQGKSFSSGSPHSPAGAAPSLFPKPGQFLYVRSRGAYLSCALDGPHPGCTKQPQHTREVWISETGSGRLQEGGGAPQSLGASRLYIGNRSFTHAELAAYAPTAQALLAELKAGRQPGQGGKTPSYAFVQITDALREAAVPPAVRRALIGALPLVPGVRDDGEVTDRVGRAGRAYSVVDHGDRKTVIVDPVSLTMLEERDVLLDPASLGVPSKFHAGDVVGGAVYLRRAVVDKAGVRP